MKKAFFLFAAFLLASVVSHAQTEKGNQTLGLSFQYNYNKSSGNYISPVDNSTYSVDNKYTNFTVGPSYSYFIADKLDLGAAVSLGQATYIIPIEPSDQEKQINRNFDAMIFLRKYFMFSNNFGLRAGPYADYTKSQNSNVYSNGTLGTNTISNTKQFDGGLRLDMVYYPSKHLGLAASMANLNYSHSTTDNGPT